MQHYYSVGTDELYHHGINGMKWGKKNGPPYPLSYKDHSAEEKKANSKTDIGWNNKLDKAEKTLKNARNSVNEAKKAIPNKEKKVVKVTDEEISKMSDSELQKVVNRLNLEKQYKNLNTEYVKSGSDYIREALEVTGSVAAIGLTAVQIAKALPK